LRNDFDYKKYALAWHIYTITLTVLAIIELQKKMAMTAFPPHKS